MTGYDPSRRYVVELCRNYDTQFVVTAFEFAGSIRRNAVGEWQLTFWNPPPAGLDLSWINSILVREVGPTPGVVYQGWINGLADTVPGGAAEIWERGDRRWELSGVEAVGVLAQRICFTDAAGPRYWNYLQVRANGDFEQRKRKTYGPARAGRIAHNLIEDNLTNPTSEDNLSPPPYRGTSIVSCPANDVGSKDITVKVRFDRLDRAVFEACEAANDFIQCYALVDVTSPSPLQIMFRQLVSLVDSVRLYADTIPGSLHIYELQPEANAIIAAGDGEGINRLWAGYGDVTGANYPEVPPGDRLGGISITEELFENTNAGDDDTANLAEIQQTAEWRFRQARSSLAVEIRLDPGGAFPYRWDVDPAKSDYHLGDVIAVETPDRTLNLVVEGVAVEVSSDQTSIVPMLGRRQGRRVAARMLQRLTGTRVAALGRDIQ